MTGGLTRGLAADPVPAAGWAIASIARTLRRIVEWRRLAKLASPLILALDVSRGAGARAQEADTLIRLRAGYPGPTSFNERAEAFLGLPRQLETLPR